MIKPKLLIFDWDGTLADSTEPIIRTFQAAFTECGYLQPSADAVRPLIGKSLPMMVHCVMPHLGADAVEKVVQAYMASYLNPNNRHMKLFADALPVLAQLKQSGYWLAVATGKGRAGLDSAIAQTDTADYWLATRCASECPSKPAPDMVLELCDELGVAVADAIVIGDTVYDLEMAANAGARAIAVTTGAHTREQLQAAPHVALIHALSELPDVLASWQ